MRSSWRSARVRLDLDAALGISPGMVATVIALGIIVVVQRDLGAALLFFGVFLALLYVATGRVSLVVIGLILFVLGSLLMALLFDHVRIRIAVWLDPFADPLGTGYQVVEALHAFARGGLVGVGLGAGLPQIDGGPPIPEIHTDFPLAALGEELGVMGVVAILGLYLVVVERGFRIGAAAADDFRSLLAVGLSLVIGTRFADNFPPALSEGAGKTGCTLHPRSRVQFARKKTHTSIQVQRKHSGLPCAMALRLTSSSPR